MINPDIALTLDEAVAEVLGLLTGLNLQYKPEEDRYYSVTRQINHAQRAIATELEWSYYTSTENIGEVVPGVKTVELRATIRPRIINDDSVKLCDANDRPIVWAYFLPRDAIDKTPDRSQLWVASTRTTLEFSRPFRSNEAGLFIHVPVMREPRMFKLPLQSNGTVPVPMEVREQQIDFAWPDLVIAKAAYFYAQSDPLMQPRVQTLEANYTNLFYALKERDERNTDSPFLNPYTVPIEGNIQGGGPISHIPYGDFRGGW